MEPVRSLVRPRAMMNLRRIRGLGPAGLLGAGLLCIGLAGCGTTVASSPSATTTSPATTPSAAGGQGGSLSAAGAAAVPKVGCAEVNQATSVTIARHELGMEPINGGTRTYTQRNVTLVRALFGDFCAAVSHPAESGLLHCPADFGMSYTGTFYDGHRVLATFFYGVSGCQRVAVSASGKTRGTVLIGRAAAAAPHLKADMAAVLGLPESQVYGVPRSQTLGPGMQGA
jgi:hypothetical protein